MDDEEVSLEFKANVEEAVAAVRELATEAKDVAQGAKDAADGLDELRDHAAEAVEQVDRVRDGAAEAADADGKLRDDAEEAAAALGHLRDEAAEAGEAVDVLRDHAAETREADNMLRDSAVEAGEALGHVRDEAAEASASVRELGDSADEASGKLDLMGLSGASSFTSLGPLVSLIAAIVVVSAAVAPAAVSAGLGLGAFAAFAYPTISKVVGALSDTKAQLAALPAPIRDAVDGIKGLEGQFGSIAKSFQPQVLGILNEALRTARTLLPEIVPLARAGATAMEGLMKSLSAGLQSSGFRSFLHLMTSMVVPATQAITRLAGTILGVLGNALTSLAPLSIPFINFVDVLVKALGGPATAVLHVIISLFDGLGKAIEPLLPGLSQLATMLINDIGSSFASFIPVISQVVGLLGGTLLSILRSLAPVLANALTPNSGFMMALNAIPAVLRFILPLFQMLASILAHPIFSRIAVDVVTAVVAFKALSAVLGLVRTAFFALDAAFDANPVGVIILAIVALVAIFAVLWTHCAGFRDFWKDAWRDIETAALDAWHFLDNDVIHPIERGIGDLVSWIESHWRLLATILATVLLGPIGGLIVFIATHWSEFRRITSEVVSDVTGFFRRLPRDIISALGDLGSLLISAGENIINGLLRGIESAVGGVLSEVGHIGSDISGAFSKVLGIFSPSRVFFQHGVNTLLGYINGIRSAAPQVRAAMAAVAGTVGSGGLTGVAGSSAYGGSMSARPVNVTVPVTLGGGAQNWSATQMQSIQTVVQEAVLRWARNNPGTGFVIPGRG